MMLIYNPIHLQRLMSTSLGEPLSEVQWDTVVVRRLVCWISSNLQPAALALEVISCANW